MAIPRCFILGIVVLHPAGCAQAEDSVWKSNHHPVNVRCDSGWVLMKGNNSKDTSDELVVAFLNRAEKASYLLRITKDVPQSQLSDDEYREALISQHLASESHTLMDEGEAELHGEKFHRIRFSVRGKPQDASTNVYFKRDGKRVTVISVTFPQTKSLTESSRLPACFENLHVMLNNAAGGPESRKE